MKLLAPGALILFHEIDLNDWEPLRSAELR